MPTPEHLPVTLADVTTGWTEHGPLTGDFDGADADDLDALRRYVRLKLQAKEIEAQLDALKPLVTDLVMTHGDGREGARITVDGAQLRFRVHTRYRYEYTEHVRRLEEELRTRKKQEERMGIAACTRAAAVVQMTVEA